MSFCKYSTEYIASSKTEVDNIFINDYLPFAEPIFVKVYLYGLYKCNDSSSFDNTIDNFAAHLSMTTDEVVGAFEYWEEQGLVRILRTEPIEVKFIPLKNVLSSTKLYKPSKYETFNRQAQDIFEGQRQITKTEYNEYYDFLERYHMENEALLMIMRYCVQTKQKAVSYKYILTIAMNWANEGILTTSQVEERLKSYEEHGSIIQKILKAMGFKRSAMPEERQLFDKWTNEFGFNIDVILHIIKKLKLRGSVNFEFLDKVLTKYYEMGLFSIMEIEEFEKNKKALYSLAKEINKTIGVYYASVESEVENYILKWNNIGFENQVLLDIAYYCFKNSIRTLEGMDKAIQKFYKLGIISANALKEYINEVLDNDNKIKILLENLDLSRAVNYMDRTSYKTWTESWNLSEELILYAASLSKGKTSPIKYLTRLLADWHEKGIKNIDEAKKTSPIIENGKSNSNFTGRSYTKEELNAVFQSIDEIDV